MIGLDIGALLAVLVVGVLALALPVALIWGLVKVLQGLAWLLGTTFGGIGRGIGAGTRGVAALASHTFRFVGDEIRDALRFVGSGLTLLVYVPLVLLNVVLGRWSTANHFGGELEGELKGSALALYRFGIGNPARFLGFGAVTEGIERRIPEAFARAPRGDRPGGLREFDGYRVLDTLPRGGSGAWLFLAEASAEKRAQFARAGHSEHERVVLKSFSLDEGSTLPQIVRESRALESAKDLGLVLEHELTSERFFYAMPYVDGDDLGVVTRRLHDRSGEDGLDAVALREALAACADVLETLDRFHAKGLWHKDIKPGNVIVSSEGACRAHLVDLGLVTPLASAMTLTTHGTEYFRDPEMVRLAWKGVRVQDVDGVKFDVYSVGALVFSMLENSFPAHGSLSQITRRCPDAVRTIVRRAMADMGKRYGSAREMLADVRRVLVAEDPFALKPAQLPSRGGEEVHLPGLCGAVEDGEEHGSGRPVEPALGVPRNTPDLDEASAIAAAKERKRKAKVRAGVLVAATLLFLFVVAPVGVLLVGVATFARADSHASSSSFHQAAADPGLELVVASAAPASLRGFSPEDYPAARDFWDPDEFEELSGRFAQVLSTGQGEWMDWLERQARLLEQPLGRGESMGRVIVLDDLSHGADRGQVDDLMDTLRTARFAVLTASVADDDASMDLLAGARSAVGLADPGSDSAARTLREFLRSEGLSDHVLWLDDDPDGLGIRYRIVGSGVDTGLRTAPLR